MTDVTRGLVGLAWPMVLRMLMLHGIVVIDAWLVAPLGEEALAAMGLASAMGGLLLGAQNACANAAQILAAQAYGSGSPARLRAVYHEGLAISAAVCLLGLAVLWAGGDGFLAMSGQSAEVQANARLYLNIFVGVLISEAIAQSLSAFSNGTGDTRRPLVSYLVSVPVNIGLSWALIHGHFGLPRLELAGAAIGSVAGAILRAAYLIHLRFRPAPDVEALPFWPGLRAHLAFALPVAATFFSAQASSSVCMLIYAAYDVRQFAALTLILPWVQVAGTFGMAWAQAVGIHVAQHLGRHGLSDSLRVALRTAWKGAFVMSAVVAAFFAVVILSSGRLYPSLAPETRAALMGFLPVLLLLPWPKNSNAICGNTLRAAGRTVYVMHIFLWSQWAFKVPLSAALVFWLDAPVFWVVALLLAEEVVKLWPFHHGVRRAIWQR